MRIDVDLPFEISQGAGDAIGRELISPSQAQSANANRAVTDVVGARYLGQDLTCFPTGYGSRRRWLVNFGL